MRISYYLVLFENILGFAYLICFLTGFFSNKEELYFIGGIGMIIYVTTMILDDLKKQGTFLFSCAVISLITMFFTSWYKGLFWNASIFCLGQIPGFIKLIQIRKNINNIDAENPRVKEYIWFVILLIVPIIITKYFL